MSKPAARVGDPHICPMVNPGPAAVPHVGMPITGPGVPNVLIGGMPAAVQGDMCPCTGPPDSIAMGSAGVLIGGKPAARMGDMTSHGGQIAMGCPTVLIGETGGGGGGGGAGTAQAFELTEEEEKEYWLEITLTDSLGDPVADEQYKVTLKDGSTMDQGSLDDQGFARIDDAKEREVIVEFPNLDRSEWVAKGSIQEVTPPESTPQTHTVQKNEYLGSIAKQHGFSHWKAIYYHPANAPLRLQRPDPNILLEGDEVKIPQKTSKQMLVRSKRNQQFELIGAAANRLKLKLKDSSQTPLKENKFEIEFSNETIKGYTTSNGEINVKIPEDAEGKALLTVWICEEDNEGNDEEDSGIENPLYYQLDLGGMDPIEETTGVQSILNNLAFYCGIVDGNAAEKTERAVKAFQASYGLTVDGNPGPVTLQKLQEVYKSKH